MSNKPILYSQVQNFNRPNYRPFSITQGLISSPNILKQIFGLSFKCRRFESDKV